MQTQIGIREEVEAELKTIFDSRSDIPEKLLESMRYSIFAGGKRLRSILVVAGAEAVRGDRKSVMPAAAALEMIHTYTLIHDDLPALDNDDLRRGVPTNHKKFGESTAILAGDGLLTLAFEVLAEPLPKECTAGAKAQVRVIQMVAKAVGAQGTVGGQEIDIEYEGRGGTKEILEYVHTNKTGKMICVAVTSGGILGGATEEEVSALMEYGNKIGLAFQIIDDILDVEGNTEELGKPAGSDVERSKMTYPALHGVEKSREMGNKLLEEAIECLKALKGDSSTLKELALFIGNRTH